LTRYIAYHDIAISDHPQPAELTHDPAAVAADGPTGTVRMWVEFDDTQPRIQRWFRVYSTGNEIPPGAVWVGTCGRSADLIVWHLYEVPSPYDPGTTAVTAEHTT
jgi:hypothetical protein